MSETSSNKPERPLSPHLSIYKPQLTSMMSISHRATGAINMLGLLLLVAWLLAAAMGPDAYALFASVMGSWFGMIVIGGLIFTVYYHLFNGIRHLCWDMGYLFKIESAYRAGYVVLLASIGATVLTWWLACPYVSGGSQ